MDALHQHWARHLIWTKSNIRINIENPAAVLSSMSSRAQNLSVFWAYEPIYMKIYYIPSMCRLPNCNPSWFHKKSKIRIDIDNPAAVLSGMSCKAQILLVFRASEPIYIKRYYIPYLVDYLIVTLLDSTKNESSNLYRNPAAALSNMSSWAQILLVFRACEPIYIKIYYMP